MEGLWRSCIKINNAATPILVWGLPFSYNSIEGHFFVFTNR